MNNLTRRFPQCIQWSCVVGLWLFSSGCGSDDVGSSDPPIPVAEETESEEGSSSEPSTPTEAYQATISGFEFTVPAGWREAPLKPEQQGFVDARFEIPSAGDEVSLTFTTSGGGVGANIARWEGQFTPAGEDTSVVDTLVVDGIDVTWIELRGTFAGMGGPFAGGSPPKNDWMMIGVAFDGQPQSFFIKLTGPREAVEGLRADLRGLVESASAQ